MDVAQALRHSGLGSRSLRAAFAALAAAVLVSASPGVVEATASLRHTSVVDASTLLPSGARIIGELPFIDALIVRSADEIPGAADYDAPVRPESLLVTPTAGGEYLDSAVASTGAADAWATTRGSQAVVALIDTGVADVPALDGAIAGEIDFTGTGGGDGLGHGTFMASVIAGRGSVATGVAPEAGILSLKVGGPDGSTTLGTVLAALDWLHGPGRSAGLRVASLAMAVEPGTPAAEYLDRAVDRVNAAGVLVVTAAGNDGPGLLSSPATADRSFSVGAVDDLGTADRGDDVAATFSGTGPDRSGDLQPDVVASGVNVVGSLPPGSVIAATATPSAEGLYTGSGTSMATAVAAGVAALASSARPDLDGSALEVAMRAGGGVVDAPSAVNAALNAPAAPGNSGSAGNNPGSTNGGGNGKGNNGTAGVTPSSIRWTSIRWTSIRWTGNGWGDASWSMANWGSIRWTGQGWKYDGPTPQSVRWTSVRWTSVRWTSLRWT